MLLSEFCKIFKNIFFTEHLRTTAFSQKILSAMMSRLWIYTFFKSSPPDMVLGKSVLELSSKCKEEHPYRSAISIKLLCICIVIAVRHGCSLVNLLHICRTTFPKNISEGLLLCFLLKLSCKLIKPYMFLVC